METTRGIFRRILNWIGRLALVLVLALASLWVAILVPRAYYIRQAARPSSAFIVEDAPVIALIHARVIDGTGSPAMDDQTIVTSRGKIVAFGASSANMPGIWLYHCHISDHMLAGMVARYQVTPR
jgi:hypothetical protein